MNNINTRIAIGGMAASVGTRSQSESHPGKLSTKDAAAKSDPGSNQINPVQTEASFSTYGSRNLRIAIVVKNQATGEVIREIPSKEMQKLHAHLDMLA
jgi:uncharacterized FlaG/YvyC family protein